MWEEIYLQDSNRRERDGDKNWGYVKGEFSFNRLILVVRMYLLITYIIKEKWKCDVLPKRKKGRLREMWQAEITMSTIPHHLKHIEILD